MKGFALGSVMGEVILFSNAAFYGVKMGFPFPSYGETVIQLAFAIVMAVIFTIYNPPKNIAGYAMPIMGYAGYLVVVFGLLPVEMAWVLPRLNWPMVIYTRGTQIMMNYSRKSTGAQSPVTIAMQAGGSAVRIFTTLVMIGFDVSMLMGYCLGTGLNTVLLGQWFIYSKYGRKWMGVEVEDKVDEAVEESTTIKKRPKGRAPNGAEAWDSTLGCWIMSDNKTITKKKKEKTPERKTRSRSRKSKGKKSTANEMTPVRASSRVRNKKVL